MTTSAVIRRLALAAAAGAAALVGCARPQTDQSYGQSLLRDVLRRHPEVKVVELAVVTRYGCVTVAATDAGDVGHKCDEREFGAIRTGQPYVEDPNEDDAAYVIADALHDASGRVVGVLIVDVVVREPGGGREAALVRARMVRQHLESRIPSLARLMPATSAG